MGAALARALAPAIRVLTVSPGVVDTDFVVGRDAAASAKIAASTPLRRIASVDDIARAILACATTLTFSTGSVIQVDGGRHL
jgi:NAD(P)-dependent dehydrogenase (short-subunit alcohol dehydrogenase family)